MTGDKDQIRTSGPGVTEPLVPYGHRVTPEDWVAAERLVRSHGRALLRARPGTNQATTAAAKLNRGQALKRGLRAYTEYLEPDGPVGVWLEVYGG